MGMLRTKALQTPPGEVQRAPAFEAKLVPNIAFWRQEKKTNQTVPGLAPQHPPGEGQRAPGSVWSQASA
jgi:hypothetical protein